MIGIEYIEFRNFLNVEEQRVDLMDQGLVLVSGQNGSGKSALLLEGPFYLLYGASLRYGDNPGKKVMRRDTKTMLVEGVLNLHGTRIRVARARNVKGYTDGLSLFSEDGADLSLGKTRDSQEVLTKMLGIGPDGFKRAVMFSVSVASFPDLGDAQKRAIIDDLLDLSRISEAHELTKEKLADATESLRITRSKLEQLATEAETAQTEVSSLGDAFDQFDEVKKKKIAAQTAQVKKLRQLATAAEKAATAAKGKGAANGDLIAAKEKFVAEAEPLIAQQDRDLYQRQTALDAEIVSLAQQERELVSKRGRHSKMAGIACPTCQQLVGQGHITAILSEYDTKLAEVTKRQQVLRAQRDAMGAEETELAEAKQLLDSERAAWRALRTEEQSTAAAIRSASEALASAKNEVGLAEQLLQMMKDQTNPHEQALSNARARCNHALSEIKMWQTGMDEQEATVARETALEQCFSSKGCRNLLLEAVIPFLNEEAARIRTMMHTPIGVQFRLRGADESFAGTLAVEVTNPTGAESYAGDSAGERRRVDLISLFSLLALVRRRGCHSFSQSFFDEAFESLDTAGQTTIAPLLRDVASERNSTFVISHNPEALAGVADKYWSVQDGKLTQHS